MALKIIDDERQRILHSKGFLTAIKPIVVICCVAGIMPVGVFQTEDGTYSVKLSNSAYLYSVICRCVTFVTTVFSTILTFNWFGDWSYLIYLSTRLGIITLAQISLLRRRQSLVASLRDYQSLEISPPLFELFAILAINLYVSIIIISIITFKFVNTGVHIVVAVYVFIVPPLVYIFPSGLYSFQMAILREAIVNLNKQITNLINSTSPSSLASFELRNIMKQHVLLRNMCFEANKTYGETILLTNAAVFVEVIYYLFIACVAESPIVILLATGWAIVNLSPTIFVMLVGQYVEDAYKETTFISNEVKLRPQYKFPGTPQQIREWRIQMKQLPLRFTANNFFELNREQIKNILATIIIYTVILIQNTSRPISLGVVQQTI